MSTCDISLVNRQAADIDLAALRERVLLAVQHETRLPVCLSIVLVTDAEIRRIHRDFLDIDTATDVISFDLRDDEAESPENLQRIDGELTVSVETATRESTVHGWSLDAELLLYCLHGFLHLCGYDDLDASSRAVMRQRERELMALFGWEPSGLQQ